MVRPVSTTILTFNGKPEKFELLEGLFHTKIKMQPEMTERRTDESKATAKQKWHKLVFYQNTMKLPDFLEEPIKQ